MTKIQIFPELVDSYNKNRFFEDSRLIAVTKINIEGEDDYYCFEHVFLERKNYLNKNGLKDICNYSDWPDAIGI